MSRLPAGSVAAMTEHGYIGAKAPDLTIIDLVGLHDPFFAHHGFSSAELFRRRPDVIWGPHPDYVQILDGILADSSFWRDYAYFAGAFNFGIALRTASPRHGEIDRIFRGEWARAYPGVEPDHYRATRRARACRRSSDR